jgi:sugar phosphate isomerase/epimerase
MSTSGKAEAGQPSRWSEAPPQVSLGTWAFAFGPYKTHPWPFRQVCEYAAETGYDGVEINGFRPHPHPDDFLEGKGLTELRSLMAGLGLGASGYAPDFHHVPPAQAATASYLAEVDKARRVCEALEVPLLRVDTVAPAGEMPPEAYRRSMDHLVENWKAAADRCARSGVVLVWEFEPGFWLNRPSEIERVASAVGPTGFGILFDSSHAYTGGVTGARQGPCPELLDSVEDYARRLLPYIRHLHLADSDGALHDEDTSVHTSLGQGLVDFPALIDVLEAVADRIQWWCVDLCFTDDADVKATSSLAYVRKLLASRACE